MRIQLVVLTLVVMSFGLVLTLFAQEVEISALELAAEVERLAGEESYWPEFEPLAIPLAVYDGEHTYLFRHPSQPDGFRLVQDAKLVAQVYEGRHPAVTANSSAEIGGVSTGTLMIDKAAAGQTLKGLATVALHEAFHVFQGRQVVGWVRADESNLFVYPIDDTRSAAMRRMETDVLRRALIASDLHETICWANQFLEIRKKRFANMDEQFAAYDRGTEVNEGLAFYVEARAQGLEKEVISPGGYRTTEVRRRSYATGAALAMILDRIQPGWAEGFHAGNWSHLDGALEAALQTVDQQEAVDCGLSAAETNEWQRIARKDVSRLVEDRVAQREAFDAKPGWRVAVHAATGRPLWPQGFDPLNVERIEGGILHKRFLKLGHDAGHLEMLNTPETGIQAVTEGVGPHPLFNGMHRVTIAGLGEPRIASDSGTVSLQVAGFTAQFENASVERSDHRIVLRLRE